MSVIAVVSTGVRIGCPGDSFDKESAFSGDGLP